jgi:hypothetical protein
MIRWVEIDVNSLWDPNRFAPHVGLFEGLLCEDIVMLHSWGDNIPDGLGFCVKKVNRVNLTKIRQKHILVREQYMFFINDELNFNGLIRFLWDVEMFDKIVYFPYFRETVRNKGSIHANLWIEFQNFVCDNFEHEFYFDYNLHKKNNIITALRRQITLDDLV